MAGRALWFDERFTMVNTTSVKSALAYCMHGVHPPLYFVLVALWRSALPSTEFSLRILSMIFGMASIAGIFLAARELGGRRAGLAAAAVAALSPYHWIYSTELRPYPLLLAFSAFSTWGFFGMLRTGKIRYLVVLTVSSILNLYSHYFAVFLLAAQAVTFVAVAWRNSASGAWTAAYRKRQTILALATAGLVAAAFAPWLGSFKYLLTRYVIEAPKPGEFRFTGRGVTLRLVRTSVYGTMGWGVVPFCIQAILVAWAAINRKLRSGLLLFAVAWILPFLLFLVRKPSHFIDAKYFLFVYPVTVAMVAGGLDSAWRFLVGKGLPPRPILAALVLLVAAAPLLPGQHPLYALRGTDWRTVIADLDQYMKPGEPLNIFNDSKIYAMVLEYTDKAFRQRHPINFSASPDRGGKAVPPEGGKDSWILAAVRADRFASSLSGQVRYVKTWYLYPSNVSLYRWQAGGPPQPAAAAESTSTGSFAD